MIPNGYTFFTRQSGTDERQYLLVKDEKVESTLEVCKQDFPDAQVTPDPAELSGLVGHSVPKGEGWTFVADERTQEGIFELYTLSYE